MDEIRNTNQYCQQQYQAPAAATNKRGNKGFLLGVISIIMLSLFYDSFMVWIVWVISISGIINSIKGLRVTPRGFAIAGLALSIFPPVFHFITLFI